MLPMSVESPGRARGVLDAPPVRHALYRFFSHDDALLYIGISCTPGSRWSSHSVDKPWWEEVAKITVRAFQSRQAALDAERAAIKAEAPRYNVQHNGNGNGGGNGHQQPAEEHRCEPRPFNVGDVVALGLRSGSCPVGLVTAIDDVFVRLDLMSFMDGYFGHRTAVVRIAEVSEAMVAREQSPEEVAVERWGENVDQRRVDSVSKTKWFDTEPLGEFQTAWKRALSKGEVTNAG